MRAPDTLSAPSSNFVAVTPSDSADLPNGECRGLYVGVAGDLTVDDCNGHTSVLFKNAAVGYHPISCRRVRATGTAAANVNALY